MLSIIASFLVGIISFMIFDYIWLAHIAKAFYIEKLKAHIIVHDGVLSPYLPAVPIVYIVAAIGIWFFVLKRVTGVQHAFVYGALFGFVLYAFYDFTNLATLSGYAWSLTIMDIVWGTFVVGTVSSIMFLVYSSLA